MSKRNISYVKPEEPSFLRKIKQQAGYKEGPTVDTKREDLGPAEDLSDGDEEQPTVVVLKEGDLTAEQAQSAKDKLEREAAETRADLTAAIVFKAPIKNKTADSGNDQTAKLKRKSGGDSETKKSNKKQKNTKVLLSFDEEENDD